MYRENEIEHLENQENTEWVNGLRLVSEELISRPFDLNETCRSPLGLEGFDGSKISNNKPNIDRDHQYLPIYSEQSRSQSHSSQAHCHPNEYPAVYATHCQNMCCFPYSTNFKHPMYENHLDSQSIRMSRPVRWGYSDTYTTSSTQSSHTSTPKATHSWQASPLPSPTSSVENFASIPMQFPSQTILLEEDSSDEVDSDSEDDYDLPFLATKKLSELDIHAKNSHIFGNTRPVQYRNCTYDELLMSQLNNHLSSSDSIKDPHPRRKASEYARSILMDWLVANKGTTSSINIY